MFVPVFDWFIPLLLSQDKVLDVLPICLWVIVWFPPLCNHPVTGMNPTKTGYYKSSIVLILRLYTNKNISITALSVSAWQCPMHKVRSIQKWFVEIGVEELDWSAESHDLNHIEHIWDELERLLRARPNCPTSVPDLTNALGWMKASPRSNVPTSRDSHEVLWKAGHGSH